MDEQPSVSDVGSTAFDAADRLAIINLLGAYAHTYDENRLDDFRGLFTESPELELVLDGRVVSGDIDRVMGLLAARKAAFKAENNQRRHALDSCRFTSQSASESPVVTRTRVRRVDSTGPRSSPAVSTSSG